MLKHTAAIFILVISFSIARGNPEIGGINGNKDTKGTAGPQTGLPKVLDWTYGHHVKKAWESQGYNQWGGT